MTLTRKLSISLIISGAINFLLIGVIVTAIIIRNGPGRHVRALQNEVRVKTTISQLPPKYRQDVADIWREQLSNHPDEFKKTADTRREIQNLLMADPIEKGAIKEAFKRLHDLDDIQREWHADILIQIAEALPQSERKKYFERTRFGRPGDRGPRVRVPKGKW